MENFDDSISFEIEDDLAPASAETPKTWEQLEHNKESFLQQSKRTEAGLPLISDDEKAFDREEREIKAIEQKIFAVEGRRTARRQKLFWNNLPLFIRNWEKFRKYPILSNVSVYFSDLCTLNLELFNDYELNLNGCNATLGGLVFAWRAPSMHFTCPYCHGQAYFIPRIQQKQRMCSFMWSMISEDERKEYSYRYFPLRCGSCGKEFADKNDDIAVINKLTTFQELVKCISNRYSNYKLQMPFEHAVHLLKLSEIYQEDPKEFFYDFPQNAETPPAKKFTDADATTDDLIDCMWEDKLYQIENASRETLLNIVHNYEKIMKLTAWTGLSPYNEPNPPYKTIPAEKLPNKKLKKLIGYYEYFLR